MSPAHLLMSLERHLEPPDEPEGVLDCSLCGCAIYDGQKYLSNGHDDICVACVEEDFWAAIGLRDFLEVVTASSEHLDIP